MPKVCYVPKNFRGSSREIIDSANEIISEYARQGYVLTLRQLYYQFVSRDLIPNNQKEYKRLGSVINDARLAGEIDWTAIEDRTREMRSSPHWGSPAEIMRAAAQSYALDKWEGQPYRVIVAFEKDALLGVFERVCNELDLPYFSCRGYVSQSEMWSMAQMLQGYIEKGQTPVILHFGDHDPSGIDMTRDIRDRLELFMGGADVDRLALTWEQIRLYNPPPNPAKTTDARYASYQAEFGDESWELDALAPDVLADLVRNEVERYLDGQAWEESLRIQETDREDLTLAAKHWPRVAGYIRNLAS